MRNSLTPPKRDPNVHDLAAEWRSYQAFSYYCDMSDWMAMMQAIAGEIAGPEPSSSNSPVRVLDVGCGPAVSTNLVSKLAWTHFDRETAWSLIEPNMELRNAAKLVLQGDSTLSGPIHTYSSLEDTFRFCDPNSINFALFIHSTYYIDGLVGLLPLIEQRLMAPRGKVIVLALPAESPFYLAKDIIQDHNSTQLEAFLYKRKIKFSATTFRSRLLLPDKILRSDEKLASMYEFVTRRKIGMHAFMRLVRTHWAHDIDFKDRLIVWQTP